MFVYSLFRLGVQTMLPLVIVVQSSGNCHQSMVTGLDIRHVI